MEPRDTPLEAWERQALQQYTHEQGSAAQTILMAQELVRRAWFLNSGGLQVPSGCLSTGDSRSAIEHLPITRLEYRLYALFAD